MCLSPLDICEWISGAEDIHHLYLHWPLHLDCSVSSSERQGRVV